jgi:outer membrane murein-binding lipoprotein Lpp
MRKFVALLIAAFVLAGLMGCSSKSETETVAASGETDNSKADQSDKSDKPDESDKDSTPRDGSIDDLDGLFGGDCVKAYTAFIGFMGSSAGVLGGGMPDEELAEFEAQFDEFKSGLPSELVDDFETVAAALDEFYTALVGVDTNDYVNPATQQKLEEASKALESSEFESASDNIQAWFEENCEGLGG